MKKNKFFYIKKNNYNLIFKKNKIYLYKLININNIKKKIKINIKKLNRKIIFFIKKKINNILNFKKNIIKYNFFLKKINNLIFIKVINIFKKYILLRDKKKNEYIFFYKEENIKKNYFKINYYYYFLIKNVFFKKKKKKIIIIISRKDNLFIKKLFLLKIPEINKGIIKIKKIVRIIGIKTKIVVYSKNKNIDPIGACIGINNIRINEIKNEINNEKIDIIKYNNNFIKYIKNIFYPFKIYKIKIIYINKKIFLYFKKKKNIYYIIGKNGINIKLSSFLLKYKITILYI